MIQYLCYSLEYEWYLYAYFYFFKLKKYFYTPGSKDTRG